MDAPLQRRAGPIPDLVSTVQGSMAHERGILERAIGNEIQLARRDYNDAATAPESRSGSPGDGGDEGGGEGWSRQSGKKKPLSHSHEPVMALGFKAEAC